MSASRAGSAISSMFGFGSKPSGRSPQPSAQFLEARQASAAAVNNPTSGNPPSAVSAAPDAPSTQQVPPGSVPYGHGAGYRVPPGTANGPILAGEVSTQPAAEVPVKAHVRNAPAKDRAEKSLLPENVSIELLLSEYRQAQRSTTFKVLLLGMLSEAWIRSQLEKRTALDRATALKKIRSELADAKLERKEARVDLFVRCYWVATLLGGWRPDSLSSRQAANSVPFSVIRLFPLLLERKRDRDSDRWQLVPAYAEAAKELWSRAVAEKLPATVVDQEISKILPARAVSIRKLRTVRLSVVQRLLARLKPEDLPEVPRLVTELQARLNRTAAA